MKDLNKKILGIILSGGMSRRMGCDKSQKKIKDKTLINLVLKRARNQVGCLAINSNKSIKFNSFGEKKYDVIPDCIRGNLGPLVGVLTGLKWAKKIQLESEWLVTFPVDSPFFPEDLVLQFFSEIKDEKIVVAKSRSKIHPVFSMWKLELEPFLEEAIENGIRKIDDFTKNFKTRVVNFSDFGYDPFFNVNDQDDLIKAEEIFLKFFKGKIV